MARGCVRRRQAVWLTKVTISTKGIDKVRSYDKPVKYMLTVSETSGTPEEVSAGLFPNYDRYITAFTKRFNPSEGELVYVDAIPEIGEDGLLILNDDGEPTVLPDYAITKRLVTKRGCVFRFGISKVTNGD